MSLFFDLFHIIDALIDSCEEIAEAVSDMPPTNTGQCFDEELEHLQTQFRTVWLAAAENQQPDGGLDFYVDGIMAAASRFGEQARHNRRFDLLRNVAGLQEQIKASRLPKTVPASRQLAMPAVDLASLVSRPAQPIAAAYC